MAFPPLAHPGPAEDQLLVLQGDHRSSYVWEGQLSEQALRPRRLDDLWEFMAEHPFHARIVARLQATGFYTIFELGRMQLDWSLITALDLQVLYGMRVDGRAVTLPHYIRSLTRTQFLDMIGQLTGFRLEGGAGGSRVLLSAIRDHMAFLHPDITGETEDLHIERYTRLALLLLFGCVLFTNTSGSTVSLRFLHHLQRLDDLPQYSWGAAVLAYLYRSMCRESMGPAVDICGLLPLLQPPLPPLAPGQAYQFLPLASRWILQRGNYRGSDAHHNLPLVRDVLDMLFVWTPYNNELLAQLPDICSADRLLWRTSVPMIFFDQVEYHATERVLRQFHRPQPIPGEPGWEATHYQRDDRARVDVTYMAWLEQQVHTWEERGHRIPPAPTFTQEATIHLYVSWYRHHTRRMIGNPIHVLGDRYRPYVGRHEALAIGTHSLYQLGQEMRQHDDNPALVDYGRRVEQLARRTLLQARDAARGRRGGGPQQGVYEALLGPPVEGHDGNFGDESLGDDQSGYGPQVDEPSSSMPSYNLQLSLPASQVTPSGALSITGTFDGDVDQYFAYPSTASEDRPTRDVDGGRRLSYASSPAVDADLPQAQVCFIPAHLRGHYML
ncbi:PREDICTED: serine/threonine-protein phosphatase 7 long form homolog [Nicotiana attenuata]|uniref:serine/threonine-protein phosphatase 7 long form homolog n=1 Tax=Nicotiana attenuata TaxID=49451 RepID=UPI000905115C|nr:PREDICTED: serine/threonine-protein phosphatase 7 long form homolog [Nicotiana attenuata]